MTVNLTVTLADLAGLVRQVAALGASLQELTEEVDWIRTQLAEVDSPDELITEAMAARLLKVSRRTLQRWRQRGNGPRYVVVGGTVRYRRKEVDAWILSRERRFTGQNR